MTLHKPYFILENLPDKTVRVSHNCDGSIGFNAEDIVSEETGAISVAISGILKRNLSPEMLERILRHELLADDDREKSAKKGKARGKGSSK